MTEERRDVEVTLLAASEAGSRRGIVAFEWPDGTRHELNTTWEVPPALRVTPASQTIRAGTGQVDRSLTIVSGEGPFRILGVEGALFVGPPSTPTDRAERFTLSLRLDPSKATVPVSDVRIVTDHPLQREVRASLYVFDDGGGGSE